MMGTITKALTGLLLVVAMTGCGGGGDSEADARDQLTKMGFSDDLAGCVLDEIKKDAGSFDEFTDLDSAAQQKMAAQAGASCATNADPDEIKDIAEDSGIDLGDEAARRAIIEGMTSTGVPEEMATCILDAAVDQGLEATDLMDATKVQGLAAACQ